MKMEEKLKLKTQLVDALMEGDINKARELITKIVKNISKIRPNPHALNCLVKELIRLYFMQEGGNKLAVKQRIQIAAYYASNL